MVKDYKNKLFLLHKLLYKLTNRKLKAALKSHKPTKYKNYNDIPYDVIKRGPLLVLVIGSLISCLFFVFELSLFYSMQL